MEAFSYNFPYRKTKINFQREKRLHKKTMDDHNRKKQKKQKYS